MQGTNFNYGQIFNEVSPNQAQYGAFNRGEARLFVFTPKVLPTQVLRSYQFNFGNELVNEISHYSSIQEAFAPLGAGHKDAINKAVLPSANGQILNSGIFGDKWTFVLIIDNDPYQFRQIRNCAPAPAQRLIGVGYFTEEPIFNGVHNPNCVMIFTHHTSTYNTVTYGQYGATNSMSINHDIDLIGNNVSNCYQDQLFLSTPRDIMQTVEMTSTGECIGNIGDVMVSNIQGSPAMVSNILKSPRHFLNNIGEAMDMAVQSVEDDRGNVLRSAIMPTVSSNGAETGRAYFTENVLGSTGTLPTNGLDMSKPMTLGQLDFHYPNLIVKQFKIPMNSAWNVSPQETMSLRNVASTIVSSALQSFASGCGLTSISFGYSSWFKPDSFSTQPSGWWQIFGADTLYPCDPEQQRRCIESFKKVLTNNLFPTLRSLNGEFDLGVIYNASGEIIIDVLYMDDRNQMKPGEAFFETSSRLGGILNPVMTDHNGLMNNAMQLRGLVDTVLGTKLGADIFHNGSEQFVAQQVNSGQAMDYGNIVSAGYGLPDDPVPSAPVPVGSAPVGGTGIYDGII